MDDGSEMRFGGECAAETWRSLGGWDTRVMWVYCMYTHISNIQLPSWVREVGCSICMSQGRIPERDINKVPNRGRGLDALPSAYLPLVRHQPAKLGAIISSSYCLTHLRQHRETAPPPLPSTSPPTTPPFISPISGRENSQGAPKALGNTATVSPSLCTAA